jgi:putative sigma-54 modulation protein
MSECEDGFMHIKISGHHVSVTPAMEASICDKLARVERHFDQINSMQVVLSLDNHHTSCSHKGQHNHKAEAILRVPGAELFAQASADDMYASISMLCEKLDRQILRHKAKARVQH